MEALSDIGAMIQQLGLPIFVLLVVIWTGSRGDWVFGWVFRKSLEDIERVGIDRDMWRDLALRGTDLAERIADGVRRP